MLHSVSTRGCSSNQSGADPLRIKLCGAQYTGQCVKRYKSTSQAVRCPGTPEESNHRQAHAWRRRPEQRSSSCFGLVPEFGISGHECTQKQILCRVQSCLKCMANVVSLPAINARQHTAFACALHRKFGRKSPPKNRGRENWPFCRPGRKIFRSNSKDFFLQFSSINLA